MTARQCKNCKYRDYVITKDEYVCINSTSDYCTERVNDSNACPEYEESEGKQYE